MCMSDVSFEHGQQYASQLTELCFDVYLHLSNGYKITTETMNKFSTDWLLALKSGLVLLRSLSTLLASSDLLTPGSMA